jgi:aminopeptidase YwaD
MPMQRRPALSLLLLSLLLALTVSDARPSPQRTGRSIVPPSILDPIIDEYSGEAAFRHVQMLATNRDRQAAEYLESFYETTYLEDQATQYGIDVLVEYFSSDEIWDAEEADLWLVEPEAKRLASLDMVPVALASNSTSADVEAEVVYVGAGREEDYEGKDVAGKIVLGSGSVGSVFRSGVVERGAAGALGTGSAGVRSDSPGYTLDQIGWQSVSASEEEPGFGFALSLRQYIELRNLLETEDKVVVRAHVKTRMFPYKMNVVSAKIPGTDPEAGDLLFVAHAFERIGTPGANDNCSGVGTTLEIARTLSRLIRDGRLPRPRRTLHFLWVPEISGSRAFMQENPALADSMLAAMNYDMTGPDLEKTDTYLRMKMTPDSVPSFLNDLIANLLMVVDQTEIRTPTGNNAPFNYRLVPFISSSDHMVFLADGIPAMQFNHWPDNFYHSSADTIEMSDPTEMKRVGVMGAAAFYYLANADAYEARDLAWEAAANGEKWIAEVTRQSARLIGSDEETVHSGYQAARNKVVGAYHRARGGVESVLMIADTPDVTALTERLTAGLGAVRDVQLEKLAGVYADACALLGIETEPTPEPTPAEQVAARQVPRKLIGPYEPEYREASGLVRENLPDDAPPMPRLASSEVAGFIDGSRSVLDIWKAVRAEYGQVTTSRAAYKFAYVVTPDTMDIPLEAVTAYIGAMEKAGLIEIGER